MKKIINFIIIIIIILLGFKVVILKSDNKILLNKPSKIIYKEKIVYKDKIIYPKNYSDLILLRNEIGLTLIDLNAYSKYEIFDRNESVEKIYLTDLKKFRMTLNNQ